MLYFRRRAFLAACERIATGRLRVRTPEGAVLAFGSSGPEAEVALRDWAAVSGGFGGMLFGEGYARGLWDSPSVEDFAALLYRDGLVRDWAPMKTGKGPGNEFFMTWLDAGMSYSAALFAEGDTDLGRAQDRKNDRMLDMLDSTERVLDLDCGWGGFAERAAERGHRVTGLSPVDARKGFADARLDGRADIRLGAMRDAEGLHDAIVAVEAGPAEAVFAVIKARLSETGLAVAQVVTTGGAAGLARAAGLRVTSEFAFGAHYAETWRAWSARLEGQRARLAHLGFGAEMARRWQLHFAASAAAFAAGRVDVVQLGVVHA